MQVPDVTAYRLDYAINKLEQQEIKYYIKKIISHKNFEKNAPVECLPQNYRVVKQVMTDDSLLELTVAPEMN